MARGGGGKREDREAQEEQSCVDRATQRENGILRVCLKRNWEAGGERYR